MSKQAAHRTFAAAALLLAMTVALLLPAEPPGDQQAGEPGTGEPRVVGTVADPPSTPVARETDPHGHDSSAGAEDRDAARAVARRFVGALLRYQRGAPTGSWLPVLRRAAARPLARRLAARPPRQVRDIGPPRARAREIEVHGPVRGSIHASALIAYADGTRSLLDLDLRRQARGWHVTALYR